MKLLKLILPFLLLASAAWAGDLDIHPPFKQVGTDVSLSSSNTQTVTLGAWLTANGAYAPIMIDAVVAEAAGISKGKVVYISGASGGVPTVSLADNQVEAKTDIIGFAYETKANTENIRVVVQGLLSGIDTAAYVPGTMLHLSTVGNYVGVPPLGAHINLAIVKTQHATTGMIYVFSSPYISSLRAAYDADISIATGSDDGTRKILIENRSGTDLISIDGLGNMNFDSGIMYIDGVNGRLGINTVSPSSSMQIVGTNITNITGTLTRTDNTGLTGTSFALTDSYVGSTSTVLNANYSLVHTGVVGGTGIKSLFGLISAIRLNGSTEAGANLTRAQVYAADTFFGNSAASSENYNIINVNLFAGQVSMTPSHTGNVTITNFDLIILGLNIEDAAGTWSITDFNSIKITDAVPGASFTVTNQTGIQIVKQTSTANSIGLWLNGDGTGADVAFGAGKDAKIYYDGVDLVINPRAVGTGVVDLLYAGDTTVGGGPATLRTNVPTGTADGAQDGWLEIQVNGVPVWVPYWNK